MRISAPLFLVLAILDGVTSSFLAPGMELNPFRPSDNIVAIALKLLLFVYVMGLVAIAYSLNRGWLVKLARYTVAFGVLVTGFGVWSNIISL